MELRGFVQNYAWGKLGNSSLVAQLSGDAINPDTPYAELWMGTHPSGMSQVKPDGTPLKEFIDHNPDLIGKLQDYWENNDSLPFLFKVLSVNKALSIQVHPDKDVAEILHHNHPTIYKDPNYKPELAIALTEFQALCGFRPVADLKDVCVNVPELQLLVSPQLLTYYQKSGDTVILRKIMHSLLTQTEQTVNEAVQEFFGRLESEDEETKKKYRYNLLKKLSDEFPGDSGIFMGLFFNEVHLAPGEALFLPAGLPHAYLSGDCIECMACSDNVVRAGLTPKYKDIETLLEILNYQSYTDEGVKLVPEMISPYTTRFNPPVPDFGVSKVAIPAGQSWLSPAHDSCQIFIVTEGEGTCQGEKIKDPLSKCEPQKEGASSEESERTDWHLKFGTIMFLPPFKQYKISSETDLQMYFAYTNSQFVQPDIPLFVI